MNFSFVFLIFATAFVLVQCDDARSERDLSFTTVAEIDCTNAYRAELRSAMMNVTCGPRYTQVALRPMPGQMFNPPQVSVRRCGGHCSAGISCAPTSTNIIQVPVYVSTNDSIRDNRDRKCTVVNVEEHGSCGYE